MPTFSVRGLRPIGDQHLLGFDLLLLAVDGDRDRDAGLGLLDLVDLGAGMEVDAALAIDARQLLGDFFVFDRDEPRQHFDDRHLAVKRTVDRGELHAHRAGADDHQRLRNLFQAQDFDVGQDAVVRPRGQGACALPSRWRESRSWP